MRASLLPLIVAFALVPSFAQAQSGPLTPCPEMSVGTVMYGLDSSKTGPFTGVAQSTFEHYLADGNVIRIEVTIRQARDSAGRTREERQMGCTMGLDGQMHPRISISINDPVAKESISWTLGDPLSPKVVRIMHYAQLSPHTNPATLTPEERELAAERQRLMRLQAQIQRNETATEQLGTRSFVGVEASGTRRTMTIPAGKDGNELPLVIVDETWHSRTLGLTVYAVRDDPRSGKSTFEYTEFTPGEPDASLFTPPPDYKIQESYLGGGLVGEIVDNALPSAR